MWQVEIVRILRNIIDDTDATTYSNSRLEEIILVAGQLLFSQVSLQNTYTIDVESHTMTPDPTTISPKDNDFINLLILKSAVIIVGSEVKTLTAQAYRVTDGPATIDASSVYKAKMELLKNLKEDLDKAIVLYQMGAGSGGQAILTPYTRNT